MAGPVVDHDSRRTRASLADTSANSNQVMPSPSCSAPEAYQTDSEITSCGIDFSPLETTHTWKGLDSIAALGLSLGAEEDSEPPVAATDFSYAAHQDYHGDDHGLGLFGEASKPFHRWIKTLQRRAQRPRHRRSRGCSAHARESFPGFLQDSFSPPGHRKSSSDSSFGYVAAVRSASVSVAGSVMTRSRRNTVRSSYHTRTERGSRASTLGARLSEDSMCYERPLPIDPAVKERLLQRRRVIEELISTEESYIGDIKFLMNVYVTILASLPTQHQGLRSSINRNLTDIVELHEEILGELHRIVPNAEYTQLGGPSSAPKGPARSGHQRWHSLDSVPENKRGTPWLEDIPGMTTDPSVAADVAQIFGERMYRFFVYEEYGAKYEMMIRDVASTHRTMPQWGVYQKGLEALAASLGSANHHLYRSRKSLTIGDLLVKPIQRICKYPLLFAELLKHTPVYDCPNSHAEIGDVLVRLREATAEINRATDDPSVKAMMEKTWLLQDRLVFPDHCSECSPKSSVRSLGQVQLCGALHVCWQTRKGVNGQYMVCVLYKDSLCLATAEGLDQHYMVQACISLNTVKIEEADNGRGLQCHTAPFSWKLVFEVDHQLYEVVMTACSPKEEFEWRTRLGVSIPNECDDRLETPLCGSLALGIKSLGTVFGKPGTVARRLSIHRATTVGPKSPLCQVILKNTTTVRETSSAGPGTPINRSQSLLTTNARIPVLAPARGERARLEALLADVWSRAVLPFPGITNRSRSEHLVRSSASAMKRKLSVASITNSFMKRSPSIASMNKAHDRSGDRTGDRGWDWVADKGHNKLGDMEATTVQEEGHYPHVDELVESLVTLNCDFSTPELGLEEDFDHVQGRLPAIRDEVERGSSCSPGPPADSASLPETVRKLDPSKLDSWWPSDEAIRQPSPVLRTTSPNSLQHCPASLTKPPSPACLDKENMHCSDTLELAAQGTGSGPAKTASKWSKAGVLNRSLVTNGLRSFFR